MTGLSLCFYGVLFPFQGWVEVNGIIFKRLITLITVDDDWLSADVRELGFVVIVCSFSKSYYYLDWLISALVNYKVFKEPKNN